MTSPQDFVGEYTVSWQAGWSIAPAWFTLSISAGKRPG
jgi:hypothetical protein